MIPQEVLEAAKAALQRRQRRLSMSEATGRIVVTERDLREQVRDLCKLFGWHFYFTWTSIHSPKGFPDLVLVSRERQRVIYVELKTEKGKVTDSQQGWLDDLTHAGQEVYLWRPGDIEEAAWVLSQPLVCESHTSWEIVRTQDVEVPH